MPSTTFVRREIAALEAQGHTVERATLRRFRPLVDPLDLEEERRTRAILELGPLRILGALLGNVVRRPGRFLTALRLALRAGRKSDRGTLVHLVYLAEACVLRNWLAVSRPDHLHVHFGTNCATVAMLCRELGGPPFSFTVHGPEEFDRAPAISLEDKIARAEFVVAISEFGRSQLMRWCHSRWWPKLRVVRCGLDAGFLRQPFTPIGPAPRLVCVARFSEQKGHLILLEAAAQLRREGRDFELVLVGDGEMRRAIEEAIARHGLEKIVNLTGYATGEQVRARMLASRALLSPSFAEGLPVVIMEALALGRPVISTYVAGIPELVQHGVCGWLVTPGAAEPLAAAMRAALDASPAELEALGREGAARVRQQHDVESTARQLSGLFGAAAVRAE